MAIDYSSNIGRLRLRIADVSDLPFLPDSVYTQVLADTNNHLPQSAITLATYILGQLAFKTHRKMGLQLEVWGKESFDSYKEFLILTITNPYFMDISPVPAATFSTDLHPLIQFQQDWNLNYSSTTQSTQLHWDALGSPTSSDIWQWPG